MRRMIAFILPLLVASSGSLSAQEEPASLSLTIDQAVEYALDNNRNVASARYSVLASEKGVWEAVAAGLPSVGGNASITDNLEVMTRIINFGGTPTAFKFGTQYDASIGVSASALIYNASWLVGIQTAKLAATMAGQGLTLTTIETKENVINVYHLILTLHETIGIIDQNLENLNEILASTRAMYSVGMAEATDVDQMQSNVTILTNSRSSMLRSLEVNYNMLRFLLGVSIDTEISLTSTLDDVLEQINVETLIAEEFRIEENINYQLIESQLMMTELSLKGAKATTLPSLASTYYYSNNGMGDEIAHMQYFPSSAIALQLQVPIFASGLRNAQIKKAKINFEKAKNEKSMISEQLFLQERQLRYNLLNANEQFKSQKSNIEIARRVMESFENKYSQGVASSLDLTQANNNYLTAQNNYISALISLLQTKVAFDKLMNKL
ncbi:TolC family protein [bacterium]|nr:TolC family protein [bacterium]